MAAWLYDRFAAPSYHLEFIPGVDLQDAWNLDVNSSDEEDLGELEVGGPRFQFWSSDEEDGFDDFGPADEDWDRSDEDSGYDSFSEEEEDEEDEEEEEREVFIEEVEEREVRILGGMLPARAVEPVGHGPTPSSQPQAPCSPAAPRPPPMGPTLDFIPLNGHKRVRDQDHEEDPSSKRPCLSSSHPDPSISDPGPSTSDPGPSTSDPGPSTSDPGPSTSDPGPSTSDPRPSTSSGTSGGFRFFFRHLLQDSESDED